MIELFQRKGFLILCLLLLGGGCENSQIDAAGTGGGNAAKGGPSEQDTGTADTDSDVDTDQSDSSNATDSDDEIDGKGDTGEDICAQQDFSIEAAPVRLMILQDISGSMADYNPSKWEQAKQALTAMLNNYDQELEFGFDVFPNNGSNSADSCGVSEPVIVDSAKNNAQNIIGRFANIEPEGNTPLLASMRNFLYDTYAASFLNDDATSYLLVVSDGDDTCAGFFGASQAQLRTVTENLLNYGVKTFVIGFGDGATPAKLNAIAKAGGTGITSFINAMNQQELEDALNMIGSSVVSCVYDMQPQEEEEVDMEEVNFYFDDIVVGWNQDGCETLAKGWMWVDDKKDKVEFCQEACEQLQSGDVKKISATFGCPTQIVM